MNVKKLTSLSLFLAAALIIFTLEAQLPPPVPIPGVKLGLANIIILCVMLIYGRKEAFTVLILRIVLASIFAGQAVAFAYSLSGGILSFIVMSLLIKPLKGKVWVISVFGAIAHNIGQICAAIAITGTPQIAYYMAILTVSGIITGAFTGITASLLIKRLKVTGFV